MAAPRAAAPAAARREPQTQKSRHTRIRARGPRRPRGAAAATADPDRVTGAAVLVSS